MKRRAGKRARCAVGMVFIMLIACRCTFALDPKFDVSQYAHTAWRVREGFTKGEIHSIAQTPDGYLWLGTEFGLLRFDGVRNVPWQPPADQHLPSNWIISLLAARDGSLWIGTLNGLASWKDGKLTQYAELDGHWIFRLLDDHEGTLWVAGGSSSPDGGRLCAIQNSNVQCYGEDGTLGRAVDGLFEDRKGNLWAGVPNGLWRWRPGPPKFYPLTGEPDGVQALGEDADGTFLFGWKGGLYRLVDGKTEAYSIRGLATHVTARTLLSDRDGSLWVGTQTHGLVHVHRGKVDVFSSADGLSGDNLRSLFEDQEGNVWVATINGLDRFRNSAIATLTPKQGLSNAVVQSVLADRDGSVWVSTQGGLDRRSHGQVETYHLGGELNDHPESLFQDDGGRTWLSTAGGIGYLEKGRFVPVSGVPGGNILSISQDKAGNLWVANETRGLFRLSPRRKVRGIPWAALGHKEYASVLVADSAKSGIWIGFFLGGIAYIEDGHVRVSYTTADGLGAGRVSDFLFDSEGTLWISTEGGLSRLKNNRLATMTSKNGLPCGAVHWAIEDDDHSMWLYTACGLLRIIRSELDAWSAAADRQDEAVRKIQVTVFDSSDGVRNLATPGHYHPQVAKTPDGRLWFLPWDGVSVVDPAQLPFDKLPPPVHIEEIIADHKTYVAIPDANGHMPLPERIRDLQIDYTALSFVAPEKVLFRYKLEGWDQDWQEAGTRRQAFYSNLPPRKYTFRVKACNNSGVWNEAGASLAFSVAPAYYQTWWFRSLCVAAFLGLLASAYLLRVRQMEQRFSIHMEARVAERARIARDLHDTLLQSFHGLMFRFQAARNMLPRSPENAMRTLDEAISSTRAAITESRDAIHDLRSEPVTDGDLVQLLETVGEELTAVLGADQNSPAFRVIVEGERQKISPALHDEVYRIAREVMRNAFRHAGAKKVEVEIRYDKSQLRLRVRDDGRGLDPKALEVSRQPGHWGLAGIHERAQQIGAELRIWSEDGAGTEIELTVPDITYKDVRNKSRFRLFRKERV